MKITVSRALFGILLGVAGGIGFGFLARILAMSVIRTEYNGLYYIENGSILPLLAVAVCGVIAGIIVPMVNKRLLRLAVAAGVWLLGVVIFLILPPVYNNLLVPWPVIGVCSLVGVVGGLVVGSIAVVADLP